MGNNAQGFVDALIFVILTGAIRRRIKLLCCSCCFIQSKEKNDETMKLEYNRNPYDSSFVYYGPRYSISSSPVDVKDIRISGSPEPTTSFKNSPDLSYDY